jgi:uncharacterized protein (TIGR03663 family)
MPEISPRVYRWASLAILAAAAFLRLYQLALKPMHHDEGVNGFFLTNLYRQGLYHYDPSNYHGPTLYYFADGVAKLNALLFGEPGLSTGAVRLVTALFGIATVLLVLTLRRYIGALGALAAAALLAVSPGNVFISRYFIHESLFVFFTLALVVAALRYYETAHPLYLMLASASAGLLFATKETAIISAGVLLIAWGLTVVYLRISGRGAGSARERGQGSRGKSSGRGRRHEPEPAALSRFGNRTDIALVALTALAVFVFVNVVFYSSFFTYWKGVTGALESFQFWAKTGSKDHTFQGPLGYVNWLLQEEAPLLLLGAVGAVLAVVRARNRFAVFAGLWAFGILAAYSLIPYKTPWLMLNFTVPLAIIGGYAVGEIYGWSQSLRPRLLALALVFAALVIGSTQAVILSFFRYDDDRYPYVYAHTQRELLSLVDNIKRLAERAGTGTKTPITITSAEYWPLPWYVRDYGHAGFYGQLTANAGPIVVGSEAQEPELKAMLGEDYQRVGAYALRPSVQLVLYARKALLER